jgi:hypothetical protein
MRSNRTLLEEQISGYRIFLERLVHNPSLRALMGTAACREAQQRSWPEAMRKLIVGYEEVVESRWQF